MMSNKMSSLRIALLRQRIKDLKLNYEFAEWKNNLHFVRDWATGNGYSADQVSDQLKLSCL